MTRLDAAPEIIDLAAELGVGAAAPVEGFFVDLEIVWTTVKNDLPKLKQQVGALLKR